MRQNGKIYVTQMMAFVHLLALLTVPSVRLEVIMPVAVQQITVEVVVQIHALTIVQEVAPMTVEVVDLMFSTWDVLLRAAVVVLTVRQVAHLRAVVVALTVHQVAHHPVVVRMVVAHHPVVVAHHHLLHPVAEDDTVQDVISTVS